jgi:hypothetical protein
VTSRENIAQAVYNLVASIPGLVTVSRKWKHFSDVSPGQQPALFIRQTGQYVEQLRGLPPKWVYSYELALYAHADNPEDVPATIQNELLDLIEAAFAPDNSTTDVLTLGQAVSHCWIEGEIETDEGLLGQQTVALIPVRVLATV